MPDGKTVTKKIPEGKWEEVLKWIEDGETDKLEALETVSEGSD
jgi:hypothetical protein